jgi:hypothetical protein
MVHMAKVIDRPSPVNTKMYQNPAACIGRLIGTVPSLDVLRAHIAERLRTRWVTVNMHRAKGLRRELQKGM